MKRTILTIIFLAILAVIMSFKIYYASVEYKALKHDVNRMQQISDSLDQQIMAKSNLNYRIEKRINQQTKK